MAGMVYQYTAALTTVDQEVATADCKRIIPHVLVGVTNAGSFT
jgi:hypothetical protein